MVMSRNPIKKEAYLIAICYMVKNKGVYESDSHILGKEEHIENVENAPEKTIYCNTIFDTEYPEGSDVTSCFRICGDMLLLDKIPQPGTYSFKVKLVYSNGLVFEANTIPVTLY